MLLTYTDNITYVFEIFTILRFGTAYMRLLVLSNSILRHQHWLLSTHSSVYLSKLIDIQRHLLRYLNTGLYTTPSWRYLNNKLGIIQLHPLTYRKKHWSLSNSTLHHPKGWLISPPSFDIKHLLTSTPSSSAPTP